VEAACGATDQSVGLSHGTGGEMRDFMIAGGLIVVILLGCLYFILF
jgi:hypothetical protein